MKWKGRRQSKNVEFAPYNEHDATIASYEYYQNEERKKEAHDIPGIPVPTPNPKKVNVTPGGVKKRKNK